MKTNKKSTRMKAPKPIEIPLDLVAEFQSELRLDFLIMPL
jgi:hypothetical protein